MLWRTMYVVFQANQLKSTAPKIVILCKIYIFIRNTLHYLDWNLTDNCVKL